ncbi:hypothetical protein EDB84DRAFT_1438036 [Lactarius hengduanensis]|nr:hypothetical protein EDB84DRAFT_1438036 [Lactarius hengduanensis]
MPAHTVLGKVFGLGGSPGQLCRNQEKDKAATSSFKFEGATEPDLKPDYVIPTPVQLATGACPAKEKRTLAIMSSSQTLLTEDQADQPLPLNQVPRRADPRDINYPEAPNWLKEMSCSRYNRAHPVPPDPGTQFWNTATTHNHWDAPELLPTTETARREKAERVECALTGMGGQARRLHGERDIVQVHVLCVHVLKTNKGTASEVRESTRPHVGLTSTVGRTTTGLSPRPVSRNKNGPSSLSHDVSTEKGQSKLDWKEGSTHIRREIRRGARGSRTVRMSISGRLVTYKRKFESFNSTRSLTSRRSLSHTSRCVARIISAIMLHPSALQFQDPELTKTKDEPIIQAPVQVHPPTD